MNGNFNFNLLIEHLQLAILLGAISSGVVEKLKQAFFSELEGTKLTATTVALTALISAVIGLIYAQADTQSLIAAVAWGTVGAQAVYATVQKLQGGNKENDSQ